MVQYSAIERIWITAIDRYQVRELDVVGVSGVAAYDWDRSQLIFISIEDDRIDIL